MKKISDFGIFGDGVTDVTVKFQEAINKCADNNEELYIEAGTYIVTTLYLCNNTHINLDKNAVIKGNPEYASWGVSFHKPIIYVLDSQNVIVKGKGEISCNGTYFRDEMGKGLWGPRPHGTVVFRNSKNISFSGVKVCDSVGWTVHLDNCENVLVDGITVRNPEYNKSNCSDGIDINGCRNIEIKNCDIETGDDAICLKNIDVVNPSVKREAMHNIYIHDCILATTCNGFKIGTETVGDIFDVKVENINLNRHSSCADSGYPEGMGMPLSAVNIESNDGADVYDISVKDFNATIASTPIFMVLQKRLYKNNNLKTGKIRNIKIENIKVEKSFRPSLLNSCKDAFIENVTIKNHEAHNFEEFKGDYKAIRACGRCYPDPYNYGHFPAYGLFGYNVKNLNIEENVLFIDETNSNRVDVIIKNDY